MIVGRMNKRISLVQSVKVPDGAGGYKATWVIQGLCWAEFKKPSLDTQVVAGAIASVLIREVNIRYRTDIKRGWRIEQGVRSYSVEHTYDYGKETTVLVVKEIVV